MHEQRVILKDVKPANVLIEHTAGGTLRMVFAGKTLPLPCATVPIAYMAETVPFPALSRFRDQLDRWRHHHDRHERHTAVHAPGAVRPQHVRPGDHQGRCLGARLRANRDANRRADLAGGQPADGDHGDGHDEARQPEGAGCNARPAGGRDQQVLHDCAGRPADGRAGGHATAAGRRRPRPRGRGARAGSLAAGVSPRRSGLHLVLQRGEPGLVPEPNDAADDVRLQSFPADQGPD